MKGSNEASKYRLKVTAGSTYDPNTHQTVHVNEDQTLRVESEHAATNLCVRIQNYTGYPDNSPKTHPYFTHPLHHKDQYSISFAISFNQPVSGDDLVFGNDFDRPIRDRLPPGFNAALRFVQWAIDPTLDGDAYADKPYMYSPAVATWNQFRVGGMKILGSAANIVDGVPAVHDLVIEEGADGDGGEARDVAGIPATVEGRRAYFQSEEARKKFEFEISRVYYADFGNQYLDFNDFSLRFPGFTVHALNYIDDKTHYLRYVLKNRATGDIYFVVLFTLVLLSDDKEEEEGRKRGEGAIG